MMDPRKTVIVTNNPYVYEKYKDKRDVNYIEGGKYLDVLESIRPLLHKGHKLLTHPLSSSLKPNETPYKSIMISKEEGEEVDSQGLLLLEDAITYTNKFLTDRKTTDWPENILDDFRAIDLSMMENTIDILGH